MPELRHCGETRATRPSARSPHTAAMAFTCIGCRQNFRFSGGYKHHTASCKAVLQLKDQNSSNGKRRVSSILEQRRAKLARRTETDDVSSARRDERDCGKGIQVRNNSNRSVASHAETLYGLDRRPAYSDGPLRT